ncbi:alpha/beta hydrolase family protein [Paraglaciecola arctica]|uniref:alpha/beta hydrolase family protein n=1 Tax=Paraglaciecola arctica TaxID=1128911 RepID=UPI001C076844|nr:alpha/beta fold hydrolase [Paraglaciecola arctica]MBU3004252.1 alpha/beta fold hydrolase [Paraglaciecola arctica]
MKKSSLRYCAYVFGAMFSLLVLPQVSAIEGAPPPGSVLSKSRLDGLVAKLGDREIAENTVAKVKGIVGDGPGVWSYEWRLLGEQYEAKAAAELKKGDKDAALENYHKALAVFRIGYLPGNFTPAERRSYDGFRRMAAKINEHLEFPFEELRIPFEGKEIVVHLYKPKGVKKPPFVLYTGGTDGSKEESYMTTQILGSKGVAVVAFDLAGTGESMAWNARPDSHKLHKHILDYFEKTDEYDFSRVGLIGGSFGGYYALKMAAEDDRLSAVINHCGLVHSAFDIPTQALPSVLRTSPGTMVYSAIRRMGFDPEYIAIPGNANTEKGKKFSEVANSFSLVNQGIVGTGKETISVPLLIVNGSRDPVVSMDDIKLVEDAATNSETWILGRASHCAPNYMAIAKPDMMDWLLDKLNQNK